MKITLCGSIVFTDEMKSIANEWESLGHEEKFPPLEFRLSNSSIVKSREYYLHKKQSKETNETTGKMVHQNIVNHYKKIDWVEAIRACNYDNYGVVNYLGQNTLIEMGVAKSMNNKINLLHPIPDVPWKEEILGIQSAVISVT